MIRLGKISLSLKTIVKEKEPIKCIDSFLRDNTTSKKKINQSVKNKMFRIILNKYSGIDREVSGIAIPLYKVHGKK